MRTGWWNYNLIDHIASLCVMLPHEFLIAALRKTLLSTHAEHFAVLLKSERKPEKPQNMERNETTGKVFHLKSISHVSMAAAAAASG